MHQQPTAPAGAKRAAEGALAEQPASKSSKQAAAEVQQQQVVQLSHAVSSDKGTRITQEDVHVAVHDDAAPRDASSVSFFAVLDGHGGCSCAQYVAERLHQAVLDAGLATHKEQPAAACGSKAFMQLDVKAAKQAIITGFEDVDGQLLAVAAQHGWADGATAAAAWLVGGVCLVANVGDAKAVLARVTDKPGGAGAVKALVLTKDHLALHAAERTRIERAGGHVSDGRLNGRMQVSRSFGDAQFKSAGCIARPDVTAFSISTRDKFLLLACDGFFSVMEPQATVNMAAALLDAGREPKAVTNRLLNEAVVVRKCKDNCSVLLVVFQHAHASDGVPRAAAAGDADDEQRQQQQQQQQPGAAIG